MSNTVSSVPFYPPTLKRRSDLEPRLNLYRSILRNPLEMWTEQFFQNRSFILKAGRRTFMQVMDPALARKILLTDADCFKKSYIQDRLLKPAIGDSLLTTEGATWRKQRRASAPAFRHDALINLVPTMWTAATDMVKRIQNVCRPSGQSVRVDIHEQSVKATYDIIEATLLSGESHAAEYPSDALASDITCFLETIGKFNLLDILDAPSWIPRAAANPQIIKGNQAIQRLRQFAARRIECRMERDDPGSDLLGLMISAKDPDTGDFLTDVQLLDNLLTFIGAGHETTALALTWAVSILSQMPELQRDLNQEVQRVCADGEITAAHISELGLHERVLMETMRLYPPVAMIPRSVIKPVRVSGHEFQEGDHITVAVYPMHRHTYLWEDPNAFDPDRFLPEVHKARDKFTYLPFGAGPRICIGMKFAMMEAVMLLASLTRSFEFRADPEHEIIPEMRITVRPKGGLPVFVSPR